jgi:excisionase family DNA binding protein
MNNFILSNMPVEEIEGIITRAVRESISSLSAQQPVDNTSELITRKQAAQMLNLSLPTLREYTVRGIVPSYRIGSRVRYKKVEVINCLSKVQSSKYRAA